MHTYESTLMLGRQILKDAGIEEFETDAFLLMSELLGMSRIAYYMRQKDEMPEADYDIYMKAIERRKMREPLQYITGRAYFMGYEFAVNPAVLIPRMDTECLVVEVEKLLAQLDSNSGCAVLDMCTGSGCIITSLALRNPMISGVGADISESALLVAKANADKLDCRNVRFVHSDLFQNIEGKYNLIVSNPPYIRTEVIKGLMEEVKSFEPYNALDGFEDGLHFYREITATSLLFLEPGGFLCYEIGHDQGEDVVKIMEDSGFKNCRVVKDLAGLDRVVIGNL